MKLPLKIVQTNQSVNIHDAYDDLVAQRDALTKACERLVLEVAKAPEHLYDYTGVITARNMARAALALTKEAQ